MLGRSVETLLSRDGGKLSPGGAPEREEKGSENLIVYVLITERSSDLPQSNSECWNLLCVCVWCHFTTMKGGIITDRLVSSSWPLKLSLLSFRITHDQQSGPRVWFITRLRNKYVSLFFTEEECQVWTANPVQLVRQSGDSICGSIVEELGLFARSCSKPDWVFSAGQIPHRLVRLMSYLVCCERVFSPSPGWFFSPRLVENPGGVVPSVMWKQWRVISVLSRRPSLWEILWTVTNLKICHILQWWADSWNKKKNGMRPHAVL